MERNTAVGPYWLQPSLKATSSHWYIRRLFCWLKPDLFRLLLLAWVQLPREGDLAHFIAAISAIGNWHDLMCLGSHCSQWKRMSSSGDDSIHFMTDIRDKRDELPYRQTSLSLLRIQGLWMTRPRLKQLKLDEMNHTQRWFFFKMLEAQTLPTPQN